ncbi:TerC family protein [uncultured Albimonas sp.]|uniref:TerC family protein n=1 Tax=uncultured Albimonas sp. TaxID=1331701 RepID=UPI0030EC86A9|tara:strand:- start:922 stop:1719 length:798 start_codon:yes stop_codon:yes gene_type:complete
MADLAADLLRLLQSPEAWVALAALIAMEVVLGIDNLIFISILTNRLPPERRATARRLGLGLALGLRLMLLAALAWVVGLTAPAIEIAGQALSWKDLILLAGGLFLVWKATTEIRRQVEPGDAAPPCAPADEGLAGAGLRLGMTAAVAQILVLDLVFSIDSVVTAVGMTPHLPIMVVAVLAAVGAMLLAAGPLARFVERHPTVAMLALGFLLMIGMTLIAEGMGFHVPKGYVYAAMGFSALVETLNMAGRRARERRLPGVGAGGNA